jgi:hypothetical protein
VYYSQHDWAEAASPDDAAAEVTCLHLPCITLAIFVCIVIDICLATIQCSVVCCRCVQTLCSNALELGEVLLPILFAISMC